MIFEKIKLTFQLRLSNISLLLACVSKAGSCDMRKTGECIGNKILRENAIQMLDQRDYDSFNQGAGLLEG